MLPDRVSNPGPLTYESGALPTALRGPATVKENRYLSLAETILYAAEYCSSYQKLSWRIEISRAIRLTALHTGIVFRYSHVQGL